MLLEWNTYSEINLDETPNVMLRCGHFFTSESVDGFVGLDEVYTRDQNGNFNSLRNPSSPPGLQVVYHPALTARDLFANL